MREAMEHVNKAFGHLCVMLVSHENVDRVAMAKQELSAAYAKLEALVAQEEKEVEQDGPAD